MRLQDYYTVHHDDALLPVGRGVITGGASQPGYVECFHGLDAFLDSGVLLMACVGFSDARNQHVVAFDADPIETRNPADREGLVARPVSVRVATPLREFLERIEASGEEGMGSKATALLERIDVSLEFPEDGMPDPEAEFARGPYDEDPIHIDVFVIADYDADMMARDEGPWVEGRALPRGYRPGFFSPAYVLMSTALQGAVARHNVERDMHVFTVNVEDDMICFPEGFDTLEPKRIYFRPVEVLASTPLPEWLAEQNPVKPDEVERHSSLTRSLAKPSSRTDGSELPPTA